MKRASLSEDKSLEVSTLVRTIYALTKPVLPGVLTGVVKSEAELAAAIGGRIVTTRLTK